MHTQPIRKPIPMPVKAVSDGPATQDVFWRCNVTLGIPGEDSPDDPILTCTSDNLETYPKVGDVLLVLPPAIVGHAAANRKTYSFISDTGERLEMDAISTTPNPPPPTYRWEQCYQIGTPPNQRTHWALKDTATDAATAANGGPSHVSCSYLVLHHSSPLGNDGRPLPEQTLPALIIQLLNAHFAGTPQTSPEPTSVFELVDVTDEETYYTLGLYLTLDQAIAAATQGDAPPTEINEDYATLEIRERKLNRTEYSNNGKKIGTAEWSRDFENDEEGPWSIEYKSNDKAKAPSLSEVDPSASG